MLDPSYNRQTVTEAITTTNSSTIGLGPALSVAQTQLALAQSQSVLFANMVASFPQQNIVANAAMAEGIIKMFNDPDKKQHSHGADDVCSVDVFQKIANMSKNRGFFEEPATS